jgi:hypothetical protein
MPVNEAFLVEKVALGNVSFFFFRILPDLHAKSHPCNYPLVSSGTMSHTRPGCRGSYRGLENDHSSHASELLRWVIIYLQIGAVCCVYDTNKRTPWLESASELQRPRDCHLSAKLVPTFDDRRCHVVSVTDPCGCILGFLKRVVFTAFTNLSSARNFAIIFYWVGVCVSWKFYT